jgi:nucleoside-diphosphate-sugar epimerase
MSDTSFLSELGAELVVGDITDGPEALRKAMGEVEFVFHCAALVSDWIPREPMVHVNVVGTKNLLEACCDLPTLRKIVVMGSTVVFGMAPQYQVNESAPMVYTGDNYNYTKILMQQLAVAYAKDRRLPVVICQAPYAYGERDRQFFPRLFHSLRNGQFRFVGDGNQPITLVYVKNIVNGMVLSARANCELGDLFLVTDGESITRRLLVQLVCKEMGYEVPRGQVPERIARLAVPIIEQISRLLHKEPRLNRFKLKFLATPMTFDISKAREVLNYEPEEPPRESLRRSIRWYRNHHPKIGHCFFE